MTCLNKANLEIRIINYYTQLPYFNFRGEQIITMTIRQIQAVHHWFKMIRFIMIIWWTFKKRDQ